MAANMVGTARKNENSAALFLDKPWESPPIMVAAERDTRLAFRGSANQRLIDVKQSLSLGQVVLWEDPAAVISINN